jgi:hypothetical protein
LKNLIYSRYVGYKFWYGVPLLLGILALFDLRVELQLLIDHFTLAALSEAVRHHALAVAVLGLQPSLIKKYRKKMIA